MSLSPIVVQYLSNMSEEELRKLKTQLLEQQVTLTKLIESVNEKIYNRGRDKGFELGYSVGTSKLCTQALRNRYE